jgi:hypothetical protein
MKCFRCPDGVYYITDFDKTDTYLYHPPFAERWMVAAPTWSYRLGWSDARDFVEISPLEILVLLGEDPNKIVEVCTK